jgi:hypothetical protein
MFSYMSPQTKRKVETMTECDHPTLDKERTVPGDRIGEYVVQIDLTEGPVLMERFDEAHDLCRADTAATARTTVLLEDRRCPKCGAGWTEMLVRPTRPSDNVADDLLLA